MISSAPFSPCRAGFSAAVALVVAAVLGACAGDGDVTCSGGRVERGGSCVCPANDQTFSGGVCVHDKGALPSMYTNVVDRGGDTGVGLGLALDKSNYPHVAYLEYGKQDLRYATLDGASGRWKVDNVDVEGDVGIDPSIALADASGAQRPVIVYYDASHHSLKGAYKSRSGWVRKFLDPKQPDAAVDRGTHPSVAVALAKDGTPIAHVAYIDPMNQDLYYLRWNLAKPDDITKPHLVDSGFSIINDQAYGSGIIDDQTSIALDNEGRPVISYRDVKNGDLKVAVYNDKTDSFKATFVDNDPLTQLNYEDLGEYSSIAVDSIDNYHVAYFDRTYGAVKYALFDGSDWTTESVDRGGVGYFTSLAVAKDRSPYIAYYDNANAAAKIAHRRRDGTWQIETVARYGVSGQYVRLALTDVDWPAIAYREVNSQAVYFDYILSVFQ